MLLMGLPLRYFALLSVNISMLRAIGIVFFSPLNMHPTSITLSNPLSDRSP